MTFNGSAAQSINGPGNPTFNHLTDANTSAALAVNTNTNVNGNLTVNANATLAPAAANIIGGAGTLTGSGTAQVTRIAATADFLTQYTIANKTLTNLTVDYSGAGAQTVNNAPTYSHLKISGSGTKTLQGTATVGGNVTLAAATFDGSSFTLNVGGNWTNSGGAFTPGTSTVNFNGSGAQAINGSAASQTFNNVSMNKSGGTLSAGASTTTLGLNTLTLTAGTLDAGTATAINVTGDWTNDGSTFTPGTSTVTFNGSAAQAINGSAASQTFNNMTVNKSGGTLAVGGSTTALTLNSATLTAGTFDAGTAATINVAKDWSNNATFTPGSGTVIFNGNNNTQTLSGASTFNNLTVNHTGSGSVTAAGSTLTIGGLFRLQGGTFTSATTYKDVQIDAGTTLSPAASATCRATGRTTAHSRPVREPSPSTAAGRKT